MTKLHFRPHNVGGSSHLVFILSLVIILVSVLLFGDSLSSFTRFRSSFVENCEFNTGY